MQFIIHVGPHKTGTTYIQQRLDESHSVFLRQGIFTPTEWRDSEPNPSHTGLMKRLLPERAPELEACVKYWENSGYKQVVISCEALVDSSPEALAILKKMIGQHPYTIVYYVRAWCQLAISAWNELIVQGHIRPLPEFMTKVLSDPQASPYINIARGLRKFEQMFGADTIRLVSYNGVLDSKGDVFEHFVQSFLGGADFEKTRSLSSLRTFDPVEAELVRVLNYRYQREGEQPSPRAAVLVRKYREEPQLRAFLERFNEFKRSISVDDSRDPIARILKNNRKAYDANVVQPAPLERFYDPRTTEIRFISSEYALDRNFLPDLQSLRARVFGERIRTVSWFGRLVRKERASSA